MGYGLPLPKVEIDVSRRQAFVYGLATERPELLKSDSLDLSGENVVQVKVYCQGILLGIGKWQRGCLYPVKVMAGAKD
jgi:hypothetical protein